MGVCHEKDTDAGLQVSERRFGNPRVVKLMGPRHQEYLQLLWTRRSKVQYDTIADDIPNRLSQGFRNAGQEYTQSIGSWVWYFFESCTTNINRSS